MTGNRTTKQQRNPAEPRQAPCRRTLHDDARRNPVPERRTAAASGKGAKARGAAARRRRWPHIVALVIILIILVTVGMFSWNRWLRYDDANDFVGTWNVLDTPTDIVLDGQSIKLTDSVSYPYTIDTGAKTIEFTFGDMSGEGRYRFSPDRSQLVIMEDGDYSWSSTLLDDITWTFDGLMRAIQGQQPAAAAGGESTVVLSRVSRTVASSSQTGNTNFGKTTASGVAFDADHA